MCTATILMAMFIEGGCLVHRLFYYVYSSLLYTLEPLCSISYKANRQISVKYPVILDGLMKGP